MNDFIVILYTHTYINTFRIDQPSIKFVLYSAIPRRRWRDESIDTLTIAGASLSNNIYVIISRHIFVKD